MAEPLRRRGDAGLSYETVTGNVDETDVETNSIFLGLKLQR